MTPEAARFLEKAQTLLDHADIMLNVKLNDEAGRTAYLAGFHAAQAFIFEHIGKARKTHKGVQIEFLRLTKDDQRFSHQLRGFLRQAYNLKSVADYETGPGSEISKERATAAVEIGKQFVARIAVLLSAPSQSSPGVKMVPTLELCTHLFNLTDLNDAVAELNKYSGRETLSAALGEISEKLVESFTGAKRVNRGKRGHDLLGMKQELIEVKARLVSHYGDSVQFNFSPHTRNANWVYCLAWDKNKEGQHYLAYAIRMPVNELLARWGVSQAKYCARTDLRKLLKAIEKSGDHASNEQ